MTVDRRVCFNIFHLLFWRDSESACSRCAKRSRIRVDLNPAELAELDRKLRSEFGPSVVTSEEVEELEVMLALADTDIEAHDPELACLRHRFLAQAEKQRLETQRAKLCALLAPMRKLPNEILLCILQYVCKINLLQSSPRSPNQGRSSKTTSPIITSLPTMAVSSVCSRWHELALSSPSLWANLAVEIYYAATPGPDKTLSLVGFNDTVTRYLERSGDWPLRLALSFQGHSPGGTELCSLIHLTQHAFRWKTFLYHGDSFAVYNVLSLSTFPLLTELDLFTASQLPWNCLKHSPRLHELATDTIPTSTTVCNQLEHLSYRGSSLSDLAKALHSCPSLKSLRLDSRDEVFKDSFAQGTWDNITSLVIKEHFSYSYSEVVFSLFNFPSLHELVIDGDAGLDRAPRWPTDAFISFISRSSCIITTFVLNDISLSDLELIAVLEVMPALLHLEVDDRNAPNLKYERSPITSHLTSSLTHHQSTSMSLVPQLQSLHLRSYLNTGTFDDSAFVSMVQSRWFKPGSDLFSEMLAIGRGRIQSVVLKFSWRMVDAGVYKPLRILDQEGLRVVVEGTNGLQV